MRISNRIIVLFFVWCLLPYYVAAHDYPISPINITLRIEPQQLTVRIKNSAAYWTGQLLSYSGDVDELVGVWPEDTRVGAQNLLNTYLQLATDGQALLGQLTLARYVEEPGRPEDSYVLFEMAYSIPHGAKILYGKVEFFKDYWRNEKDFHGHGAHLGEMQGEPNKFFISHMRVAGHKSIQLALPIETPEFTLPIESHFLPRSEYLKESLAAGFLPATSGLWFAAFLLAALLILPTKKNLAWTCAFSSAGALIGFGLIPPLAQEWQPIIPPALVIGISVVTIRNFPEKVWVGIAALGTFIWSLVWKWEFIQLTSQFPKWTLLQIMFLAGKLLFVIVVSATIGAIFWAYRKRQRFLSESMAPIICKTHARFAAIFLVVLGLIQLGRHFLR